MGVEYEKLPTFCSFCHSIGHTNTQCNRKEGKPKASQSRHPKGNPAAGPVFVPKKIGPIVDNAEHGGHNADMGAGDHTTSQARGEKVHNLASDQEQVPVEEPTEELKQQANEQVQVDSNTDSAETVFEETLGDHGGEARTEAGHGGEARTEAEHNQTQNGRETNGEFLGYVSNIVSGHGAPTPAYDQVLKEMQIISKLWSDKVNQDRGNKPTLWLSQVMVTMRI